MRKSGFTLIELLMVVLIIGILSAVAMPWYESTVDSSRYTQLQTAVKSLKDALEVARMNLGAYPDSLDMLDIGLPSSCTVSSSNPKAADCGKFYIMYMDGTDENVVGSMNPNGSASDAAGNYVAYVAWLDMAQENASRRECRALSGSARMQKLCEGQPGTEDGTAGGTACPLCKRYWLD